MKNQKNIKSIQRKLSKNLSALAGEFKLADTPLYPLAFQVPMPENFPFACGQVSFGFHDFSLTGLDEVEVKEYSPTRLRLGFPSLGLRGCYDLQAKHTPKTEFDFGGNMMPLESNGAREAGADPAPPTYDAPDQTEVDSWTTNARTQKPKVANTKHGPNLLTSYNEHNDSYNDVFILNPGLQKTWSAGNVTAQMSRDTHSAVQDDNKINANEYVDQSMGGVKLTYNTLAIMRQAALAAGCYYVAENKLTGQRAKDMHAAGAASLTFKSTLENNLGGESIDIMTPAEVYATLNKEDHTPAPKMSVPQFRNTIEQGSSQDGGKGATEEALKNGWPVLSEEERALIRKYMYDFHLEDARVREEVPHTLWSGPCSADLNKTEITLTFSTDEDGKQQTVSGTEVFLPAFLFDIDDSQWQQPTAEAVRDGLNNLQFVRSLIQKKLEADLGKIVSAAVIHE